MQVGRCDGDQQGRPRQLVRHRPEIAVEVLGDPLPELVADVDRRAVTGRRRREHRSVELAHTRTLGTSPSNLLAIAAVALTEQAHDVVERHADLLAWLEQTHEDEAGAPPPVDAAAIDDDEREAVERLRAVLREQDAYSPRLDGEHTLESAILTTFHGAGLRRRWHFESALCSARWPAALAAAMAAGVGQIIGYPVDLPAIVYDPSARAEPGPGVPPIPIIPKGDDDV